VWLSGIAVGFDLSWRIVPARFAGRGDILAIFKIDKAKPPRQIVWAYTSSTEIPVRGLCLGLCAGPIVVFMTCSSLFGCVLSIAG
jgi:hypothetical protein